MKFLQKMVCGFLTACTLLVICCPVPALEPATEPSSVTSWNHNLSLSGKGYWKKRIAIDIVSSSPEARTGLAVSLPIIPNDSTESGALPLAGLEMDSLRLYGAAGDEFLFTILNTDGKPLDRGTIPEQAKFVLPVTCAANGTTRLFLYYDNPDAWRSPNRFEYTEMAGEAELQTLQITTGPVESYTLKENRAEKPFPDHRRYAAFTVVNESNESRDKVVVISLSQLEALWCRSFGNGDLEVVDRHGTVLTGSVCNDDLFINAVLEPMSREYFYIAEKENAAQTTAVRVNNSAAAESFPGTMLQVSDPATSTVTLSNEALPANIIQKNLVKNGDFELPLDENHQPPEWNPFADNEKTKLDVFDSGLPELGKQTLRNSCTQGEEDKWCGWRQHVPVRPGLYLFGVQGSRDTTGVLSVYFHPFNENGDLIKDRMNSVAIPVNQPNEWALSYSCLLIKPGTSSLEIHLTCNKTGTYRYDNICLMEMEQAQFQFCRGGETGVFQVPSIRKVFPETAFDTTSYRVTDTTPARISSAVNEQEMLQLAICSPVTDAADSKPVVVRATVTPPVLNDSDSMLPTPEVYAAGLVPIDTAMGYHNTPLEPGKRLLPPAGGFYSDGWLGYWPDPLVPVLPVDDDSPWPEYKRANSDSQVLADLGKCGCLAVLPNETRGLLLKFTVPNGSQPGIYHGTVTLKDEAGLLSQTLPYTLQVFDVTLPAKNPSQGIFDVRMTRSAYPELPRTELFKKETQFLLDHLLIPDKICIEPPYTYNRETGEASIDWEEFDSMAEIYFNDYGIDVCYSPYSFYLFGWGLPPANRHDIPPYLGEYPYEDVDRRQLNPEFKKAYQALLRVWWSHLCEKGWADKFRLYISDEPFYTRESIINQMKALCDMIHEVDPAIKIYSSTWLHVPEWDGFLDILGIGRDVVTGDPAKIKSGGADIWWTTDGHFCIDTPYCATERLLPWWCCHYGAGAYEFWGCDWYTYNPFEYGWHSYIHQSDTPGVEYMVRYPNGDGYLFYPGPMVGIPGIVSSVRIEQAREGQEDAKYLALLKDKIAQPELSSEKKAELQSLYDEAMSLAPIPTPCGRFSTQILADPDRVESLHYRIGLALAEPTP